MDKRVFSASDWKRLVSNKRKKSEDTKKFFEIVQPQPNEIWADIGCGPGYFTIPLAKSVKKVFATDISREMLQLCKTRAQGKKIQNIEYIKSGKNSLNLEKNSVNKILLANVYHEFENREKVVCEINNILILKGYVYIIDWKYEDIEAGPPFEHRLPTQEVLHDFITHGFTFIGGWDIYETKYVLGFKKTREL